MLNKNYLPIITPIIIFITGLGFLGYTYYKNISNKPAALSVTSKYQEAMVTFRGKDMGESPVEATDLKPGRGEIIIKTDNHELKKEIILTEEALTAVSADVGVSDKFYGSLIIWYDKSGDKDQAKLFVASNPSSAAVKVNDKDLGETPLTISNKDILEDPNNEYTVLVEKEGYEAQKLTIKLEKGYVLNIQSDLFLKPISKDVQKVNSTDIYTLYAFKDDKLKQISTGEWASAAAYWLETRGAALFGADNISYFDYFVDSDGTLYNGKGNVLEKEKSSIDQKPEKPLIIAYLNNEEDEKITEEANKTLSGLLKQNVSSTKENLYEITETGIGYLNVRKSADLNGEIVGRVNVGDQVEALERVGDWYRIIFETQEAYVYATYLKKVEPIEETEGDTQGVQDARTTEQTEELESPEDVDVTPSPTP